MNSAGDTPNDSGGSSNNAQIDPLPISGHQIVEEDVKMGSVATWKCADCGTIVEDVKEYFELQCE